MGFAVQMKGFGSALVSRTKRLMPQTTSSPSLYIRKRGEGELAVLAAFADATLLRPAVMFGPDELVSHRHARPPSAAADLSDVRPRPDAIAARLCGRHRRGYCSAYAASRNALNDIRVRRSPSYSYEELLRTIAREAGLKTILIPVTFTAWYVLAWFAEILPIRLSLGTKWR